MSTSIPASPVDASKKVDLIEEELKTDEPNGSVVQEPLAAPDSLYADPGDEDAEDLSDEIDYPVNEEVDDADAYDGIEKEEEEPVTYPSAMPLSTERRFKSVGNPAFKLVGARPKHPSRFVTVGKDDYKTIKASISSMTDIYKSAQPDEEETREETVLEEDEPLDYGAEEDEEFHTAVDDTEAVAPGVNTLETKCYSFLCNVGNPLYQCYSFVCPRRALGKCYSPSCKEGKTGYACYAYSCPNRAAPAEPTTSEPTSTSYKSGEQVASSNL